MSLQTLPRDSTEERIAFIHDVANFIEKLDGTWATLPASLFDTPQVLFETDIDKTVFDPIASVLYAHGSTGDLTTIGVVIDHLGILTLHPFDGWAMEYAKSTAARVLAGTQHGAWMTNWEIALALRTLLHEA